MFKLSGWTIASTLAVIFYSWQVVVYSDNLPKYDDLHDAFGFFIEYHKATSVTEKLQSFFYPNNEHVTLVNHLIYWLQVTINGELNFRQLVWLGNLFIIGTALLATKIVQPAPRYINFFIIVGYLSLSYWDSSFKAMTAISNQAVIFFALLSLIFAEKNRWSLAIVAALACQYSQVNGVFIWPLLLVMIFLQRVNAGKLYWLITCWGIFSTALYFKLSAPFKDALNAALPESLKAPDPTFELIWQLIAANPLLPINAFLNFMGSAWLPNQLPWLMSLAGIALLALFFNKLFRAPRLLLNQRALLLFIGFLLASMAIIATTRALTYQDALIISASRYNMYPLLFSLLTITLYLPSLHKRFTALFTALLVSLLTLSSLPVALMSIQHQTQGIRNSLFYWLIDGDFRRHEAFHIPNADLLYFHAEYLDIWNPYLAVGVEPLRLSPAKQHCPAIDQLPYCRFQLQHRLNGLAVQLINPSQLDVGSQLQFCSSTQSNYISSIVTAAHRQQTRLLIDRARISHHYQRVVLYKNNTALCQTPIALSPRDREQEVSENLSH